MGFGGRDERGREGGKEGYRRVREKGGRMKRKREREREREQTLVHQCIVRSRPSLTALHN